MIEDDIRRLVTEHYERKDAQVLLLSTLGAQLTRSGLWPVAGDDRTLLDIVEADSRLSVARAERARAFIVIVLAGDERRAVEAIAAREKRMFLGSLPRAVLMAFTIEIPSAQLMCLRLGEKILYEVGPAVREGAFPVESDLRLPGLDASDVEAMSVEDVERLETNIKAWSERHHRDPAELTRRRARRPIASAQAVPSNSNALERLLAAQEPDVAQRMTVPIDIALALSRMV